MAEYLDKKGLGTLWTKIKSTFQTLGNLVTSVTGWSSTPSDSKYPSEKLVKTALDGKADKVSNATAGNFAGLAADGNLIDSGKKASDFATAAHAHSASDITSGTLALERGGTGKTSVTIGNYLVGNGTSALNERTPNEAANDLINALSTGSSTPVDADYYISQYVNGGETTKTYHRRPMLALWEYIKGKISSVLGLTASSYGGNASTATTAAGYSSGGAIATALGNKADRTNFYAALVGTSDGSANWVKIDWGTARAGRAAIAVVYGCENGSSSGSYQISFFKPNPSTNDSGYIRNINYRVTSLGNASQVPRVRYSETAFYLGLYSNGNWSWNVSIQVAADTAPTISQVVSTDSGLSAATPKTPNTYVVETGSVSKKVNGYVGSAPTELNLIVDTTLGTDTNSIYIIK